MTALVQFSTRIARAWEKWVSTPLRWVELHSLQIMGARFTISVLTVCILFMTVGVTDLDLPAQDGLIIVGVAGLVVGIGSLVLGCTYQHLRWMGFVLVVYGVVGIFSAVAHALANTRGVFPFLQADHHVWVWMIITFFGCRLMIFPTHARLVAIDTLADIQAAGAQAEIDIRRKD